MNIVIDNLNSTIINEIRIDAVKHLTGTFDISQIFSEISNIEYDKVILDITALNNVADINTFKSLVSFIKPDNLILVVANTNIIPDFLKQLIDLGIYNYAYNSKHIVDLYNSPNTYNDAIVLVNVNDNRAKIIGIKNVTKHAGATTLTYILYKQLKKVMKVTAIEIDKMDFNYFYDKNLVSTPENRLEFTLDKYYNSSDLILIDVNESKKAVDLCDDILYLVEPTTIRINQLMLVNPSVFQEIGGRKLILNKSMFSKEDIKEFEFESHSKVFHNIPYLNERQSNEKFLDELIMKLNL